MFINSSLDFDIYNLDEEKKPNEDLKTTRDIFHVVKDHQEWFMLPLLPLLLYIFLKFHYQYHYLMDTYIVKRRLYLIEHKQFPCTFLKKMYKESRMNPQLHELWVHYMNENYVYDVLVRAKILQEKINKHIAIVENLPLLHNLSTYEPKENDSVYLDGCTMDYLNKERAVAELLTRKFYALARKDNFLYCRLSRYEKPILSVDPKNFVGAWLHREIGEFVPIGSPKWWTKQHYAPDDLVIPNFYLHKVLNSDYVKFDY